MSNPMETLDWLAKQFRDRANEDPEEHTETDAKEVEEAKEACTDMLAALKRATDWIERISTSAACKAAKDGDNLEGLRHVIAKAEGRADG